MGVRSRVQETGLLGFDMKAHYVWLVTTPRASGRQISLQFDT